MAQIAVFHSSFDSTRYTGADRRADHPNLAQAQAEAVTCLLMGRALIVNNTYAFDSRTFLNLSRAILDTRERVRGQAGRSGRERIDATSPVFMSWFGHDDFFSCCADQLRRMTPGRRLVLSYWKAIDDDDRAREDLAVALTTRAPSLPASVREYEGLEDTYQTLLKFDDYCRRQGCSARSQGPEIPLLTYLQELESLERPELETIIGAAKDQYRIDLDTVMKLRESIAKVDAAAKSARSWAHAAVNQAGGEDAPGIDIFLLEQRQLIDTLYNENLADSAGSGSELLSSVPRTVGAANLERVNAFALELIKYVQARQGTSRAENPVAARSRLDLRPGMTELFAAGDAGPDLPAAPLEQLLAAYWELTADDDRWLAWRDSCDQVQLAVERARRLYAAGRPADSRLGEVWAAHLDLLQAQLPHVRAAEQALITSIELHGKTFHTETRPQDQDGAEEPDHASMAAGEYIDRHLQDSSR
jgi:hypothetical protein